MKADNARFVHVWQTSPSIAEAARILGVRHRECVVRAAHLRAQGVDLKRYPRRASVDYAGLARLAHELVGQPDFDASAVDTTLQEMRGARAELDRNIRMLEAELVQHVQRLLPSPSVEAQRSHQPKARS